MSRLKADLLLLLVAFIWGTAFVAQKEAFDHVGPYTFAAARFILSAVLVLPFALREHRAITVTQIPFSQLALLCLFFTGGVVLQQVGIGHTTITNAGFLTGLYVLFVPLVCWLFFKEKISKLIMPAALLSVIGVWLLSGGTAVNFSTINMGDVLVFMCAACFGVQVALIGRLLHICKAPFQLCVIQYLSVAIIAGGLAAIFENVTLESLKAVAFPIFYAGAISGGIAYTLQIVAQQYTPASDTAVIVSSESVFAAIAGVWLMGDRLNLLGWSGCGLIMVAILLVEFGPYVRPRRA